MSGERWVVWNPNESDAYVASDLSHAWRLARLAGDTPSTRKLMEAGWRTTRLPTEALPDDQ